MLASLSLESLQQAVFKTVAYSDIFDYPLTFAQLHRYLEGVPISAEKLQSLIDHDLPAQLRHSDGYITLAHRAELIEKREARSALSQQIWPEARRYGRLLTKLPYVRMVAVTGSLAVDNSDPQGDIDYFIVTASGRLWLTRALVIAVVRLAARRGVQLCPNYLVSEDGLDTFQRTLYTAREMTQMVPLSGLSTYYHMRQLNSWTNRFLPNAAGLPRQEIQGFPTRWQAVGESLLYNRLGTGLEQWEMRRKIRKLKTQEKPNSETRFSASHCKGHFNAYHRPTLTAYQQRTYKPEQLVQPEGSQIGESA